MGLYGASSSKAGVNTAGTTMWNLWSTGATMVIKQLTIGLSVAPTTAPDLYVVRSSARGTQTASVSGQPYDPNDNASTGALDTTWSANPTVGAVGTALARLPIPAAAGAGWVDALELLDGYIIRNGAGLAIVNANASGATLGTFVFTARWRE